MPSPAGQTDETRHALDRLVVNGPRVFGWGWVSDRTRVVRDVHLEFRGEGWERRMRANFGLERPDVAETCPGWKNAGTSGFVVTGYVPGPRPARITLSVTLDDGTTRRFEVSGAAEERYGEHAQRRKIGWLFKALWRRLKRGDVRGILRRVRAQNYIAPYLDEAAIVRSVVPMVAGSKVVIVFDHNMGGGANHYRRQMIADRVSAGQAVLLCTYNLPTLDYRLCVHRAERDEAVFRMESFVALELVLEKADVAELFVNSPVSFDEPLMLAEWLTRMRSQYGVRLIVTVHDYFAVCPSFVLLDADERFCGIPDMATCSSCLKRHAASYVALSPPTEIGPWRALWGQCLRTADEVRCFSDSSTALLLKAHPTIPRERLRVVPHDVEFVPARKPRIEPGLAPVIGILGQISPQKGAHVVRGLVELIERARSPARVVVIGTLDVAVQSRHLSVTGPYRREDLVERIEEHGVNVLFFPSIWPETFSYVVSEMMALDLPIVAFDLGAPGERLRPHPRARLCGEVSPQAALEAIMEAHAESADRRRGLSARSGRA